MNQRECKHEYVWDTDNTWTCFDCGDIKKERTSKSATEIAYPTDLAELLKLKKEK